MRGHARDGCKCARVNERRNLNPNENPTGGADATRLREDRDGCDGDAQASPSVSGVNKHVSLREERGGRGSWGG